MVERNVPSNTGMRDLVTLVPVLEGTLTSGAIHCGAACNLRRLSSLDINHVPLWQTGSKREIIRGTFIMVDTWGQTAVHHVLCALQVDRRRATTHTTKHWNAEMPATYGLKKKQMCFDVFPYATFLPTGLAGLCDGMRAILSFVLEGGVLLKVVRPP